MAFDYKKEYKAFYAPTPVPALVEIPPMQFLAVRGKGNPNAEEGEYSRAIGLLYGVAYTLKMSYKGPHRIPGFFEYVVPPLEGFWWQEGIHGVDYTRKDDFCWISLIRLPDFIQPADFQWAIQEATRKKKIDFSPVEHFHYHEGCCVQCLHIGPYDEEPATTKKMERTATENGYVLDLSATRYHHEIYLSDPRKTAPAKLRTILRHPVKKR